MTNSLTLALLLALVGAVLGTAYVHPPDQAQLIQGYIDGQVRHRFSEISALAQVGSRSEGEDTIFDYLYKSGLEVVVKLCPSTQSVDIIEYNLGGEIGSQSDRYGRELCKIPKIYGQNAVSNQ